MLVRGINSAASCQYHYVEARMDIKLRKRLLQRLSESNGANIPDDGENGELVQLITDFFVDEPTSDVEEEARSPKTQPH